MSWVAATTSDDAKDKSGYRNGARAARVKTAGGPIAYPAPQVTDTDPTTSRAQPPPRALARTALVAAMRLIVGTRSRGFAECY